MTHPSNPPNNTRLPVQTEFPTAAEFPTEQETRRVNSSELLAGAQEVQIEHEGQTYRLRRTKAGKLILTK